MRSIFLMFVGAVLPQCLASDPTSASSAALISSMPSCSVPCFVAAMRHSTCSATDVNCLCANTTLQHDVARCVMANCTLSDALVAKNTTQTSCGEPVRDRSAKYVKTIIPLAVITIVITVARLVFKQFFSPSKGLGPDDWAIVGTLVVCISGTIIGVHGLIRYGLGKDVWTLTTPEITKFAQYFYIMQILYLAGMSLIKLSLSLFYLQIFTGSGSMPIMRFLLWTTVVVNVLYGVIFIILAVFECSPVSFYWERYLNGTQGRCININFFGWLNAGIGVFIDVWMIGLPLHQVLTLRLHWKKKIGVIVMFMLGTFVTVVSILRLQYLIHFAKSSNPTWDQWNTVYWSTIEINVGMICTCLPSLRLILVRLFPTTFGASRSPTYQQRLGNEERSTHWGKSIHPQDVKLTGLASQHNATASHST